MTYKQMCETIAWVHREQTGETLDPHDIFCMSSTGELWPVHMAFDEAEAWLLAPLTSPSPRSGSAQPPQ